MADLQRWKDRDDRPTEMSDLQRCQTYRDVRPTEMSDLQRWKDRDDRPTEMTDLQRCQTYRDVRPTEMERQR